MPGALEAGSPQTQPAQSSPVPATEGKAEEGDLKAPKEADKAVAKEGEGEKPKPEKSEADKAREAMQKRIDRQTAASKALNERIRQLEQEKAQWEAKAPKAQDEPKQEDFDDYDKWQDAVIEHRSKLRADEKLKAEKEKELKETQERRAAEVRREFETKESAFRTSTPDYDRVAGEAVETVAVLGQAGKDVGPLLNMVMHFENPPEMLYRLGQDINLIEQMVGMPPLQIMRELVKLESAPVSKEIKQAPEPIEPVRGKGGVKPLAKRSGKEILEWVKG